MLHTQIKPMLLHKADVVPSSENYIHQLKLDGHRCLFSYSRTQGLKLYTRHQNECTAQYPEMRLAEVNADEVVLDGEMVVIEDGKPCFESLMQRFQAKKSSEKLVKTMPVSFVAFDILYLNGQDLRKYRLTDRLEILKSVVVPSNMLSVCDSFSNGEQLFEATKRMDLEGIVSKHKDSTYQLDTRSHQWLKIKNYQYEVVEIGGMRKADFGWSLFKDGRYVGVTEFVPPNERKAFFKIAQQLVRGEDKNWVYLNPLFKCKVKFQAYTKQGLMRTPSFVEFVF